MRPHIAVATDFSDSAQKMVDYLDHFRPHGAQRITLIYAREVGYPIAARDVDDQYYTELLKETALDLRDRGWEVDARFEQGRPGSAIVEVAAEEDVDMIALANRGHSAVSEVVLGSVATDVLERAKRPVFLFSSEASSPEQDSGEALSWDRIVCPTDFSDAANKAATWAGELAARELTPLILLHALDDRYHGHRAEKTRRQRLEGLRDRLRKNDVQNAQIQLVEGRPKEVIAEVADHYPGALFVMGTQGRGWFGDLMLGGVSRSMARRGTHHALFVPQ